MFIKDVNRVVCVCVCVCYLVVVSGECPQRVPGGVGPQLGGVVIGRGQQEVALGALITNVCGTSYRDRLKKYYDLYEIACVI